MKAYPDLPQYRAPVPSFHSSLASVIAEKGVDLLTYDRDGHQLSLVSSATPKKYREAVENAARHLLLDTDGIGGLLYNANEYRAVRSRQTDRTLLAFLWSEHVGTKYRAFGACCFRGCDLTVAGLPGETFWRLYMVWLKPSYRGVGYLHAAWPSFEALFGKGFLPEPPVSPSMQRFLDRRNHQTIIPAKLMRYLDDGGIG